MLTVCPDPRGALGKDHGLALGGDATHVNTELRAAHRVTGTDGTLVTAPPPLAPLTTRLGAGLSVSGLSCESLFMPLRTSPLTADGPRFSETRSL